MGFEASQPAAKLDKSAATNTTSSWAMDPQDSMFLPTGPVTFNAGVYATDTADNSAAADPLRYKDCEGNIANIPTHISDFTGTSKEANSNCTDMQSTTLSPRLSSVKFLSQSMKSSLHKEEAKDSASTPMSSRIVSLETIYPNKAESRSDKSAPESTDNVSESISPNSQFYLKDLPSPWGRVAGDSVYMPSAIIFPTYSSENTGDLISQDDFVSSESIIEKTKIIEPAPPPVPRKESAANSTCSSSIIPERISSAGIQVPGYSGKYSLTSIFSKVAKSSKTTMSGTCLPSITLATEKLKLPLTPIIGQPLKLACLRSKIPAKLLYNQCITYLDLYGISQSKSSVR